MPILETVKRLGRHASRAVSAITPSPAAVVDVLTSNARKARNPGELAEAQRLYETFHGKPHERVTQLHEPVDIREELTALGWLVELVFYPRTRNHGEPVDPCEIAKVRRPSEDKTRKWETVARDMGICLVVLTFEDDRVTVASNAEGTQLYLIGGRQDLSGVLENFHADQSKDFIELGDAIALTYLASKAHSNFEPLEWEHILGEESGRSPFGYWNRLQSRVFLIGGEYTVEEPGIIN